MPHATFPTSPDGLVVDALVGLPAYAMEALQQAGQPIPPPVLIRALLDTGSDATAVSAACAKKIGLKRLGRVRTRTASGNVLFNLYEISFSISRPNRMGPVISVRTTLHATEWLHPERGLDALVGLDVLLEGLLILDGPGQQFTLAF
jgi:hypothetical protein